MRLLETIEWEYVGEILSIFKRDTSACKGGLFEKLSYARQGQQVLVRDAESISRK